VKRGKKGKGILIHCLTEANGLPLSATTTGANQNEGTQVVPLLEAVHVQAQTPGRPKKRVKALGGDKAYDSKKVREQLRKRSIQPQIPKREWKGKRRRLGRPVKITVPRWQMERAFAWLQRKYRRLVVRWERVPRYFNAFLQLALIHLWANKLLLG